MGKEVFCLCDQMLGFEAMLGLDVEYVSVRLKFRGGG